MAILTGCARNDDQPPASADTEIPLSAESVSESQPEISEADELFQSAEISFKQPGPLLVNIDSRTKRSLNGTWRIIVDPMDVGYPGSVFGGFPDHKKSATGMELIEYDFERAETIQVPGDWNTQKDRLLFYQGVVWYYRTFEHTAKSDLRTHLWFGGANYDTQIFLNGAPIGRHSDGYVPFSFDVTEHLKTGPNQLLIRIDNRLSEYSVPTKLIDWWPYGGLIRDVFLVETPTAYIRSTHITLLDHTTKTIRVEMRTSHNAAGATAEVAIPELDITASFPIGSDGVGSTTFTAPIELWSPESPRRYDVVARFSKRGLISSTEDQLVETIGFRTISTERQRILLNGKPLKLRGISMHEEPIDEAGVAFSRAHITRLLQEAKELNANFVRAAHYPYSRHLAQIADELGVLLWEEIPIYWNIDWRNPGTLESARNMLTRLIERDRNRASVVIWSVANETPYSEARMRFLKALIQQAKALDSSRLVSAALLGGGREEFTEVMNHIAARALAQGNLSKRDWAVFNYIRLKAGLDGPSATDKLVLRVDDPIAEYLDLIAYNQYFGWYYSVIFSDRSGVGEHVLRPLMLELMRDMSIRATVDKPLHISEFGAGAKYGLRGKEGVIWSEEYQNEVYKAQLDMLQQSPQVQGMTPWILKDFRAMLRPLAKVQDYYNRKGLLDEQGRRKMAYFTLQKFYGSDWSQTR